MKAARVSFQRARIAAGAAIAFALLSHPDALRAWEHENSKVAFTEYREGVIEELERNHRPYFLLFSAEWCHWCHEFGDNTLTDDRVAQYLNEHFTSVFIDADVHSAAYVKYRATGLPFTVFLNPDASPHFRYAGTLYAYDFLTVLKQVKQNVDQGLSVEGAGAEDYVYLPPAKLSPADVESLADEFRVGVLESFDPLAHGLGKGEKAVYPRTFLYLLGGDEGETREEAITAVHRALDRAIERIYDPVEGGFFRYAETRDWKIPHYEKMADLNAGTVLLLFRLNDASPTPTLVEAADKTLGYLTTTLYAPELGVFLSFQEADTRYYGIKSREDRARAERPAVIERIFIDRLAATVDYLLEVLDYRPGETLETQIRGSLDFVADALERDGGLSRYYTLQTGEWSGTGTLQDYVLVAKMFLAASRRFDAPRYARAARRAADEALARYLDRDLGIVADPSSGNTEDAEFLMEMNGLLAETLIGLDEPRTYAARIDAIVTYFSAMGEILGERLWDAQNWEFTERYVPYLRAVDRYVDLKRPRRVAGLRGLP